jgi:hypothetical protein
VSVNVCAWVCVHGEHTHAPNCPSHGYHPLSLPIILLRLSSLSCSSAPSTVFFVLQYTPMLIVSLCLILWETGLKSCVCITSACTHNIHINIQHLMCSLTTHCKSASHQLSQTIFSSMGDRPQFLFDLSCSLSLMRTRAHMRTRAPAHTHTCTHTHTRTLITSILVHISNFVEVCVVFMCGSLSLSLSLTLSHSHLTEISSRRGR